MNRMKYTKYNAINSILSEWNPIGIPDDMKDDEYKGYIPCIMANLSDINSIRSAITKMLQAMGVEIDLASGIDWASDIDLVCNKIYHIGNKNI
ncbi:MAG: hypothetical protein IJE43_25785 [Alphaproteobacteria bacterium]|nr:hypothetical protein [Alphaproteobacteria bacterium]